MIVEAVKRVSTGGGGFSWTHLFVKEAKSPGSRRLSQRINVVGAAARLIVITSNTCCQGSGRNRAAARDEALEVLQGPVRHFVQRVTSLISLCKTFHLLLIVGS